MYEVWPDRSRDDVVAGQTAGRDLVLRSVPPRAHPAMFAYPRLDDRRRDGAVLPTVAARG